MTEINPTDPTQVSYPWRTAIRTGAQTTITVLLFLVAAAPIVVEFVEQFWPDSPVIVWVLGVAALAGAAAAMITRLMALEIVNRWLTSVGAGATPRPDPFDQ